MTLLEMIKKYKKIRQQMCMAHAKDDKEIVEAILEDLRSVEAHPSVTTMCDRILEKIGTALDENAPDEALSWARTLQTLPD